VNLSATSFVRAAVALERTAQVRLSGEWLRRVVEAVGRRVLKAQQEDDIAVTWHAEDCLVPEDATRKKTRVYTGCDGVMVPIITEAEKIKRRDKVKANRRRCGKKCKPLPPRKRGSDLPWKEFKVAFFYSENAKHQHVAFTHGNHVVRESCCDARRTGCGSRRPTNVWDWWTGRRGSRADAVALRRVGRLGFGLLPPERKRSSRAAQSVWRGIA